MLEPERSIWAEKRRAVASSMRRAWSVLLTRGPSQFQFWVIALIIGIAAGFAALLFRKGINALQYIAYGTEDMGHIHSYAAALPWYWVLTVPIVGGLIVGQILHHFTPDGRARGRSGPGSRARTPKALRSTRRSGSRKSPFSPRSATSSGAGST